MTQARRAAVAVLAAALSFPTLAHAQDLAAVTTADLNLRAGPGPQFPIVAMIPTDAQVTLYGCLAELTWCDVAMANGDRGWAYAYYLQHLIGRTGNTVQTAAIDAMNPPPPTLTFEGEAYWTEHYANAPFFADRARFLGADAMGADAMAGALIGRPLGAAIGGAAGAAFTPPDAVVAMLQNQGPPNPGNAIMLEGEIVVGAAVPDTLTLTPVPDFPEYAFAHINGRWVLIDPTERTILYIEPGEAG
jgi:uncharacterized protein YraI